MEPLEVVLRRIEDLKRDLSAEIEIQPGIIDPVYEDVPEHQGGTSSDHDRGGVSYVTRQERKAIPDEEKIQAARIQLQQIYDSSEWYSTRYKAGEAIGKGSKELENNISEWVVLLQAQLNSKVTRQITCEIEVGPQGPPSGEPYTREIIVDRDLPDEDRRLYALKELEMLFIASGSNKIKSLIQETYEENEVISIRRLAGKALGYSDLRIWAHEHPAAVNTARILRIWAHKHPVHATLTGVATVGAAYAFGLILYKFLSK